MGQIKFLNKNIVAMIPARMGSRRLAMKNLAILNGKPLIYYAIAAAKEAGIFSRIVVNSENDIFAKIAARYAVEFYKRPARLATSGAKSDFVVEDFIKKNPSDILVWINPTSPLQSADEIRKIVGYFLKKRLDSLITVKNEQVHFLYKGKPVNFMISEIFSRTQDLIPLQSFVYSIMMWRTKSFKDTLKKRGSAMLCGKSGFYPVGKLSSLIIKKKEDLMLAEFLLRAMKPGAGYKIMYDKIMPYLS